MKKYSVSIPYYCNVVGEFEAENKEQAIEKAYAELYPSLCHQCSREIEIGEANTEVEPNVEEL